MSVRSKNLKLLGVASAAALTVGAFASPALAAGKTMTFTCAAPLGPTSATLTPASIPTTLAAGQKSTGKMTVVIHLTAAQTTAAGSLGQTVKGTITAPGENHTIAYKVSFPSTTINTGSAQDITAKGTETIPASKPGTFKLNAGSITAALVINNSGTDIPVTQTCTPPTDGTQRLATITVVKDSTTTAVKASYSKAKKTAVGTATVTSKHGLKATGKVKFVLKKGTHKVATMKSKLNRKGVAKAAFKGVRKSGKYSIKATYGGNANLKGSSGKARFTVR